MNVPGVPSVGRIQRGRTTVARWLRRSAAAPASPRSSEPPSALPQRRLGAWPSIPGSALRDLTDLPFRPRASRAAIPPRPFVMTTERCQLSCVMCHFKGPNAVKKFATLDPALVRKALVGYPPGERLWFVATGEFFSDPNALVHLRTACELGLHPQVITHGQLLVPQLIDEILEIGVREIMISVDAIDPDRYARIRRGGRLEIILDACAYLRTTRARYPDLRVGVSAICFAKQREERAVVEAFWRERVDYVQFVSENYDIFRFRRIFSLPRQRTDCEVKLIPLPTGRVAPCCAIAVYAHDRDVSWLPHLADDGPDEAYKKLCDMYDDPGSPLGAICKTCDWWVQFQIDRRGDSPIYEKVEFAGPAPS